MRHLRHDIRRDVDEGEHCLDKIIYWKGWNRWIVLGVWIIVLSAIFSMLHYQFTTGKQGRVIPWAYVALVLLFLGMMICAHNHYKKKEKRWMKVMPMHRV
jgi:hypothetical protein